MVDEGIDQSEPTFARGADGRMHRLQYLGRYLWSLHVANPDGSWKPLRPRTFDELVRWGRNVRLAGDPQLPRDLGIRLTGANERRYRLLGCDARCLGVHSGEEGDGEARRLAITGVHAETAFDGSIRVWIMRHLSRLDSRPDPGRTEFRERSGLRDLEGIRAWLASIDVRLPPFKVRTVRDLLEQVEAEASLVEAFDRRG